VVKASPERCGVRWSKKELSSETIPFGGGVLVFCLSFGFGAFLMIFEMVSLLESVSVSSDDESYDDDDDDDDDGDDDISTRG
jgi:hypothetical protein